MDDNSALTPQEVADKLKIAKNTVYELIKRGELNSYRVGKKVRVDLKDMEEYKNRTMSMKGTRAPVISQEPQDCYSPLKGDMPESTGFVICGQDVLLDILSRYLQIHPKGVHALRSYVGSYDGLYSLYQRKVKMAAAHLWDGDTGIYNIPYVKRMLPGVQAVIIHLACRMQGFYVAKGNPKEIKGWEDLGRKDITIINREKGSGTRVLLDEQLRILGIPPGSVQGYLRESTSHLAIASTVARGGADLGIGNEKSGQQVKGIDFIPLHKERYELVVRKEDMDTQPVKTVLEILSSKEFQMELAGVGGYDLAETGRITAET